MPVANVPILREDLAQPLPAVLQDHPAAPRVCRERDPDIVGRPCGDRRGQSGFEAERAPDRLEEVRAPIGRETDDCRPSPDVELVRLAGEMDVVIREPVFGPP